MQVGEGEHGFGVESYQMGAGPYQETVRPANPHGDFYLTRAEKNALKCFGGGAFSIDLMPDPDEPRGGGSYAWCVRCGSSAGGGWALPVELADVRRRPG